MCGITGFTGNTPALPFLLQGLEKLEYRGYDSAGVSLAASGRLETYKAKGRLAELEASLHGRALPQTAGIGHTRWATHGVPSQLNAHPHTNADETIAIVHNGIIENYRELKEELQGEGYVFRSQTDSEVVVHLLDRQFKKNGKKNLLQAFLETMSRLEGSYAVCAISTWTPDLVFVARKESPMIIGHSSCGSFCGSDIPALLDYTKDILLLEDGQAAVLSPADVRVLDFSGKEAFPKAVHVPFSAESARKGGYDTFMLKEIHEQPHAIRETLRGRFRPDGMMDMHELDEMPVDWKRLKMIYFIGCGTAYHAGLYACSLLRKRIGIPVECMPASEFRYGTPLLGEHTFCVFISQSGETADTLAALKRAQAEGSSCLAVTNVLGSSLARQAGQTLYTCAGPEIAVASTKAFTTQMVLCACLDAALAERISGQSAGELAGCLRRSGRLAEETLQLEERISRLAARLKTQHDAYFIGRQLDYCIALEGALKLKEISYIHADAYYAGELKHGPIALIESGTVVFALATQEEIAAKTLSNIQETIARGADVILITTRGMDARGFENVLRIPDTCPELRALASALIVQMFAYYAAVYKGCDVDKPRNLAKSVTVE